MDQEEERVQYLARVGREKIFKYGTYTVTRDQKPITQDHPFYEKRDDALQTPPPPPPPEDPEALAAQVMSNNYKVGLSQEEVDALLNGIN
ncbi:MAG: hypothetical protein K6F87_06495 [Lachnospiraceae bacterium]|nr:hypothetical protein [Lachnospiraceae bacterium]